MNSVSKKSTQLEEERDPYAPRWFQRCFAKLKGPTLRSIRR